MMAVDLLYPLAIAVVGILPLRYSAIRYLNQPLVLVTNCRAPSAVVLPLLSNPNEIFSRIDLVLNGLDIPIGVVLAVTEIHDSPSSDARDAAVLVVITNVAASLLLRVNLVFDSKLKIHALCSVANL